MRSLSQIDPELPGVTRAGCWLTLLQWYAYHRISHDFDRRLVQLLDNLLMAGRIASEMICAALDISMISAKRVAHMGMNSASFYNAERGEPSVTAHLNRLATALEGNLSALSSSLNVLLN